MSGNRYDLQGKFYQQPFSDTRSFDQGDPVQVQPRDLIINTARLRKPQKTHDPVVMLQNMTYGKFSNVALSIGVVDSLVLPAPVSKRIFLLIQNTHGIQNLFVAFGTVATNQNGVRIGPGGSLLLDNIVAQDDVHIIADGLGTTGVLLYSNKNPNED